MLAARVLLLLTLARAATAQEVRGTVRDSATSQPVLGAVVTLMDATDAVLARSLTNQGGEFRIRPKTDGARLRVVRLGFRPRVLPLSASTGTTQLDVTLTAIPVTLESVRTLAATNCPKRSDASAALSLLEQARSGLLATIVSRSVEPARMKRLFFDRRLDGNSDRITHQRVRIDSVVTTASFAAARSASEFAKQGFMRDSAGIRTFLAPDAETLLDDGFAGNYCFRIMDTERSRPNQIGLGFRVAANRRDRVDIDGALWIDTLARALIDIEFRYTGLDRAHERYNPGGRVSFQSMPNGVVLVDRWTLRLVDTHDDPTATVLARLQSGRRTSPPAAIERCPTRVCPQRSVQASLDVQEVGAELARAVWDDGTSWEGALGRLVVRAARDDARRDARAVMKLDDTNYHAVSDASGDLAFDDLLPGPYDLVVVDPELSRLGIALTTGISFAAARDSTLYARVTVPNAADYAEQACGAQKGSALLLGRITTPEGVPVAGAQWMVQRSVNGAGWEDVAPGGTTGADGRFQLCALSRGMVVRVVAQHANAADEIQVHELTNRLTIVTLQIKPRPRIP